MTKAAFLKLPIKERRAILQDQCTPEIVHHYEVTCPECGLYYPGHATGGIDICTCPAKNGKTPKDRKQKIETVLVQAEMIDGAEALQAWRRLCRELGHMAHPEARMPRFNGLLHSLWIAASNDQT